MNNKPIISIITPVYNCADYIEETIKSVISQEFTDWELIIVDDGSKDNSAKICDAYSKRDNRIKVFHIENGGVSNARNYGLKQACGKYVAFLDGDDMLLPETLKTAYEQIEYCDLVMWGYDTFPENERRTFEESKKYSSREEFAEDIPKLRNLINVLWNKLYKRDVIFSNSITFCKDISLGEDLLFNLLYFQHCDNIRVIPHVLYKYRVGSNGSLTGRFREDFFDIQKLLKQETDKTFSNNEEVKKYTSIEYVSSVIGNIQTCVYSNELSKKDKIRLLNKWLHDEFFFKNYEAVEKKIKIETIFKTAIKKRKTFAIYYLFRIRKIISRVMRNLKM